MIWQIAARGSTYKVLGQTQLTFKSQAQDQKGQGAGTENQAQL